MRGPTALAPELESLLADRRIEQVLYDGLIQLPPGVFEEVAHLLLDGAETFLNEGHPDLAQAIAQAVSRSTKAWGQRQGRLAGYAEAQAERGRQAERLLGQEGTRGRLDSMLTSKAD